MAKSSLQDRKFWLIFAAWWVTWSGMHIIILSDTGLPRRMVVVDSLVSNSLLALSCLLVSNNMRYYLPRKEKHWYVLAVSFGLSALWLMSLRVSLRAIFRDEPGYLIMISQTSGIRYAVAFLINGCMVVINLLIYTQKEKEATDARKTETERLYKEAELYKLHQQLQPHFLFNSLNSISALTGSRPEEARHMIQQLSDFLRGSLKKDEMQWTSLREEMQYLQLYLEIEKVRFGYRMQTRIEHDPGTLQMKLPSMLLQPIVENAIKYGLYDTIGEVLIVIVAKNNMGNLEVEVQNPFDEVTAQSLQGTGFGLASIKRRLYLLFARHDLLKTKTEDGNFITSLIIPQMNQELQTRN